MSRIKLLSIGILILCICLEGCFDIFSEDQNHFVGSISLINPHNQDDNGYKMIIYEKEGFNANILEDYIVDIRGNDTLLLVKCIRKIDCNLVYYKLLHNKGERPIQVNAIDLNTFRLMNANIKPKYKFNDENYRCQ